MIDRAPLLLLALATVAPLAAERAPEPVVRHLAGNPDDRAVDSTRPGVLLAGGGGDVDEGMVWLVSRAGGGDVVVLRASGGDGYNAYLLDEIGPRAGGLDSVESLVFSSRGQAFDAEVLATIAGAELIWIAGGDQSRYARFWTGTPLAAAVAAHARAGKPIGGTSAGLAILGDVAYTAEFPPEQPELDGAAALEDPFDRRLTLAADTFNVPTLDGILTDSHFSERRRLGRLVAFLARAPSLAGRAARLGVGVDERTALVIDGEGSATVFGKGKVHVVLPPAHPPHRLEPGQALEWPGVRVVSLGATDAPFVLEPATLLGLDPLVLDARDGELLPHASLPSPPSS